jgi:Ca2+:H+ antiporter
MLWLLVFVPIALAAEKLNHEAHTLHFILSVLAILPLAVLLSHATESVAAKTGDSVGSLLNATLGNLTELVIAIAALQAGQSTLKSRRVDCRPLRNFQPCAGKNGLIVWPFSFY